MIRLPDNRSRIWPDRYQYALIELIERRYIPGVSISYGYGPSYGVDDDTLDGLWGGKKIQIPGTLYELEVRKIRGPFCGTHMDITHYPIYIDGDEDEIRDSLEKIIESLGPRERSAREQSHENGTCACY